MIMASGEPAKLTSSLAKVLHIFCNGFVEFSHLAQLTGHLTLMTEDKQPISFIIDEKVSRVDANTFKISSFSCLIEKCHNNSTSPNSYTKKFGECNEKPHSMCTTKKVSSECRLPERDSIRSTSGDIPILSDKLLPEVDPIQSLTVDFNDILQGDISESDKTISYCNNDLLSEDICPEIDPIECSTADNDNSGERLSESNKSLPTVVTDILSRDKLQDSNTIRTLDVNSKIPERTNSQEILSISNNKSGTKNQFKQSSVQSIENESEQNCKKNDIITLAATKVSLDSRLTEIDSIRYISGDTPFLSDKLLPEVDPIQSFTVDSNDVLQGDISASDKLKSYCNDYLLSKDILVEIESSTADNNKSGERISESNKILPNTVDTDILSRDKIQVSNAIRPIDVNTKSPDRTRSQKILSISKNKSGTKNHFKQSSDQATEKDSEQNCKKNDIITLAAKVDLHFYPNIQRYVKSVQTAGAKCVSAAQNVDLMFDSLCTKSSDLFDKNSGYSNQEKLQQNTTTEQNVRLTDNRYESSTQEFEHPEKILYDDHNYCFDLAAYKKKRCCTFKCDLCAKSCTTKAQIERHLIEHMPESSDIPDSYALCANSWTSEAQLEGHLMEHQTESSDVSDSYALSTDNIGQESFRSAQYLGDFIESNFEGGICKNIFKFDIKCDPTSFSNITDFKDEYLKKSIKSILKGADLDKLSTKKVRLQLQRKFNIDLSKRKREIDRWVMEMITRNEGNSVITVEDSDEEI